MCQKTNIVNLSVFYAKTPEIPAIPQGFIIFYLLLRHIGDRMKYKHLFFDLDDTFWDVSTNQKAAQARIYDSYGMSDHFPDFEEYYERFRKINQKLWDDYRDGIIKRETLRNDRFLKLLQSAEIDDPETAFEMSNEYLRIAPTFNALMPDSIETLEYLYEKGYPMSLITNGFNETQFHKVEYSGLKKFFNRIVTSEFAGIGKPNPGIFEYAMRKQEIARASDCVMIGDDIYNDVYGASTVGMPCIYINLRGTEHDQRPTYEVASLKELRDIL